MVTADRQRRLTHGLALATACLVLIALTVTRWHGLRPDPGHTGSWFAQLLGAVVFGYVGAVVADRTVGTVRRVGLLLQLPGLTQASTLLTSAYLHRAVAGWPATGVVRWLDDWVWAPGLLAVVAVFPLVYPTGIPLPRLGPLLRAAVVVVVAGTIAVAVAAVAGVPDVPVGPVLVAATAGCALGGVLSLAMRYRRGDHRLREQVRWLVGSVLVVVLFEPVQQALPRAVAEAGFTVLPLLVPAAVGIAVLRHGLYDIDLLLTRALAYLMLGTLLAAVYVGVVVGVGTRIAGASLQAPAVLAAVAVALVANPLRVRLRELMSRWLRGAAADPQRILSELNRRLGQGASVRDAPQTLVDTVAEAFRASYVELVAEPPDGGSSVVARSGTGIDGHVVHTAVAYADRHFGELRTGLDEPPERHQVAALAQVATLAGPVLDGWLLAAELQASRAAVVTAREEERSRLHRDLHDGLGPTLGGITLGLDAARNLLDTDLAAARPVLDRLSELAGHATGDVRALVEGLRPVTLDKRGLVETIRRHADVGDPALAVHVDAELLEQLAPAVEVAALRIVLEALANIRRHAHARTGRVALSVDDDGVLTVLVEDDGTGLVSARPGGVGLDSIRARAAELGGVVTFGCSDLGGLRVLARIPVNGNPRAR